MSNTFNPLTSNASYNNNTCDNENSGKNSVSAVNSDDFRVLDIPVRVLGMTALACLSSCNLGYDLGVNAGLSDAFSDGTGKMELGNVKLEMLLGCLNVAAIFGALSMGYFTLLYGRRHTFNISSASFILGIIMQVTAMAYGQLFIGRMIMGFGVGIGLSVVPMYIAEISPKRYRGFLVSMCEFALNIGLLLGYFVSFAYRNVDGDKRWRGMIGIGAILPTILLILVNTVMYESPRWLCQTNKNIEAARVLGLLSRTDETEMITATQARGNELVSLLEHDIEIETKQIEGISQWSLLCGLYYEPNSLRSRKLFTGLGTALTQQSTGIEAFTYYMIIILNKAGVSNTDETYGALLIIGFVKTSLIYLAGYLLDVKGRKTMLFASHYGCMFGLVCLALAAPFSPVLGFIALLIFVVSFSIGIGPGAWLLISEVFSLDIRAPGMSLATATNRFVGFITVSTFLSLTQGLTISGVAALYFVIGIGNIYFTHKYIPETNGVRLEKISLLFGETDPPSESAHISSSLTNTYHST